MRCRIITRTISKPSILETSSVFNTWLRINVIYRQSTSSLFLSKPRTENGLYMRSNFRNSRCGSTGLHTLLNQRKKFKISSSRETSKDWKKSRGSKRCSTAIQWANSKRLRLIKASKFSCRNLIACVTLRETYLSIILVSPRLTPILIRMTL